MSNMAYWGDDMKKQLKEWYELAYDKFELKEGYNDNKTK